MARGQFRQYLQSIGVPYEIAAQQIEAQIAWAKIVRRKRASAGRRLGRRDRRRADPRADERRQDRICASPRSSSRSTGPIRPTRPSAAPTASVEQLRRGAPFGAVAQQFSQGATAQAGGDLGWVLPGSLDPHSTRPSRSCRSGRPRSRSARPPAGTSSTSIDRRPFAAARPDDVRLNLGADDPAAAGQRLAGRSRPGHGRSPEGDGGDSQLHRPARPLARAQGRHLGRPVGHPGRRPAANPQMYEQIPKLAVGGTAGPFRVAEGLQIVALCSKVGATGCRPAMPSRSRSCSRSSRPPVGATCATCAARRRSTSSSHSNDRAAPLAVTMGEPAGIGGELSLKAWSGAAAATGRSSPSTTRPASPRSPGSSASTYRCREIERPG